MPAPSNATMTPSTTTTGGKAFDPEGGVLALAPKADTVLGVAVGVGRGVGFAVGTGVGVSILWIVRVAVGTGVGGTVGVTAFELAEAGPVPAALIAATVKV